MSMIQSFEALVLVLQVQLTVDERADAVAYAAEQPVTAGTRLEFPGVAIDVSTDAYVAFIDRQPTANWGHPARYLIVNRQSGEVSSVDARFPPFRRVGELHWRLVYQAPSVPDAAVAFPQ
jgi:hypothetical protein